jgi:hypothetical protein
MLESSLEIARLLVNSGSNVNVTDDEESLHYTRQHDLGIATLRNCYLYLAQVSKLEIKINGPRCAGPV